MTKTVNKGSVLFQYLLSYIGIAVLSCALVGVFIFNLFLNDLKQAELDATQNKVNLAAKDLESQLEILQNISYNISFNIIYRPLYFTQNKYNEKVLLEDFVKYEGYSMICEQYFLLYDACDSVFLSSGYTNPVSFYLFKILGISDPVNFREELKAAHGPTIILLPDGTRFLITYPVRASTEINGSNNAVLCFITSARTLLNRIDTITGGLDGISTLEINGALLHDNVLYEKPNQSTIRAVSPEGVVRITAERREFNFFYRIYALQTYNLISTLLFVFLLIGIAAILAFRSFKPIKRIHSKMLNGKSQKRNQNELLGIETMFAQALENNEKATGQLASQMRILKGQGLQLLMSGDYSDNTLELLHQLGVQFFNDCFIVMICYFYDKGYHMTEDGERQLITLVEDLSGEELKFLALRSKIDHALSILVNMKDESLQDEAVDLVRSVLESNENSFVISTSSVTNSLQQIQASYLEALNDCEIEMSRRGNGRDGMADTHDPLYYDGKHVVRMLRAVRTGNYYEACVHLDEFTNQVGKAASSYLLQRYIFSEVLVSLVQTSRDLKVPIDQHRINTVLMAQNQLMFRDGVAMILKTLCHKIDSDDDNVAEQVLAFIQEHCLEYDMSLERLAQEFNLTANYLSRLIKQAAGENYKDYVIQLKINRAKELLVDGVSVSHTCEKVGYVNISHFIKTFKKITGLTPSGYKKRH